MKQLIIIAHGSKKADSNQEVTNLANLIKAQMDGQYQEVSSAFQELASPDIASAVSEAKAAGVTHIDFFPYFLVAGKHVSFDLPTIIAEAQAKHSELTMRVLPYLGSLKGLSNLIIEAITPEAE